MTINPGTTFLFPLGCSPHLYVVLTPPLDGEAVVVKLTTLRPKSETLVVLHRGDHPFLTHDSVPAYAFADFWAVVEIERALANNIASLREPATAGLVKRLLLGLIESDRTPNHVRRYARELA